MIYLSFKRGTALLLYLILFIFEVSLESSVHTDLLHWDKNIKSMSVAVTLTNLSKISSAPFPVS